MTARPDGMMDDDDDDHHRSSDDDAASTGACQSRGVKLGRPLMAASTRIYV